MPTATLAPTPTKGGPWTDIADYAYDGYWWREEVWVPGYISLETWYRPAPRHMVGRAVFYAPGVMRATAEVRGLSLEGFLDGVSLMSPADIGRTVWLLRPGGNWEGPFLVVDCARRGDMWPIIVGRDEVVEVGWDTADRWGMGYGKHGKPWSLDDIEVWVGDEAPTPMALTRDFPVQDYSEWFLDRVQFATLLEDNAKGRIWSAKGQPTCWLWWTGTVMCPPDFYSAYWLDETDYQPAWISTLLSRWKAWR
jgi:hypothetical protein